MASWKYGIRPQMAAVPYHHVELAVCDSSERQTWQGEAIHQCGDDLYAGEYHLAEHCLNIRHKISGPKKDLVIKSDFSR